MLSLFSLVMLQRKFAVARGALSFYMPLELGLGVA